MDEMTGHRYETVWRNKWLTAEARSIEEMVADLRSAASELEAMAKDGVVLDPENLEAVEDDHAFLITEDPVVAAKYGFEVVEDGGEEKSGEEG